MEENRISLGMVGDGFKRDLLLADVLTFVFGPEEANAVDRTLKSKN